MKTKEIKDMLEEAQKKYDSGKFSAAITSYKEIKKHKKFKKLKAKEKITVFDNYGMSCYNVGNKNVDDRKKMYKKALAAFTAEKNCLKESKQGNVIQVEQKIANVLIKRCWLNKDAGKITKLQADYNQAIQIVPQDEKNDQYHELKDINRCLWSLKADAAYDKDNYKDACNYYDSAIKILEGYVELAENENNFNKRYYSDLYVLADSYQNSAECWLKLNDKAKAIIFLGCAKSSYEKLISVDPQKEYKDSLKKTLKCLEEISPEEKDQILQSNLLMDSNNANSGKKRKLEIDGLEIKDEKELMEMDEADLEKLQQKWKRLEEKKEAELNNVKQEYEKKIEEQKKILEAYALTF